MKLIIMFALLIPLMAQAACRTPIYIGKPAADEVTRKNYNECLERENAPSLSKSTQPQQQMHQQQMHQQQMHQQQMQQMQQIEQSVAPRLR